MKLLVSLTLRAGPQAGRLVQITSFPFTVGRDDDADYTVDDPRLGLFHLEFVRDGNDVRVQARYSDGPVFLNGERIAREELRDGDVLAAGATEWDVGFSRVADRPNPSPFAVIQATPVPVEELGLYHFGEVATRMPASEDNQPMFAEPPDESMRRMTATLQPDFEQLYPSGVLYGVLDAARDADLAYEARGQGY